MGGAIDQSVANHSRFFALAVAFSVSIPVNARAMGAVVGKAGETAFISTSRMAVATSATRTTRWAQITVQGASAGFVWLVPVGPGARIDPGSDAWLDALDAATAPVIVAPSGDTTCNVTRSAEHIPPVTCPLSVQPTLTKVATDMASLGTFVGGAGYAVPPDVAAELQDTFSYGLAVAMLVYPTAASPTHTVRVLDGSAPSFPLALSGSAAGNVDVTAFVVAGGPQAAGAPIFVDPTEVLWENDGSSTYVQLRTDLLQDWQGTRWLTESATPSAFFTPTPVSMSTPLPSVLAQYFWLASAYGDTMSDPTECASAAQGVRSSTAPFAALCPTGVLDIAPGQSPCTVDAGGDTAVDPLRCGDGADDAAFAVAGLAAQGVWVTRVDGLVTAESAGDVSLVGATSTDLSPVVTAGAYASTCTAPPPPPSSSPPDNGSGGGGGGGGGDPDPDPGAADLSSADDSSDACDGSDSSDAGDSCSCDGSDVGDACDGAGDLGDGGGDCGIPRHTRRRTRSPLSRMVVALAVGAAILRRRGRPDATVLRA